LKNQPVEEFPELPATEYASSRKRQVDYEASDDDDEDDDDDRPARPAPKKNFFKRDVE
jgi:hypothetical protein